MLRAKAKSAPPRPLVQGDLPPAPPRDTRPVWYLAAGFMLSAVSLFAILHAVADASGVRHIPPSIRVTLALAGCALCFLVDLGVVRHQRACSVGPRRQTRKNFIYRYGPRLGPFMWGLDTGLAVTTFRMATLTWAVIGMSLLDLAPWWLGVAYGLGFSIPLAWAVLIPRWREPEPVWIVRVLVRSRWAAQVAALAVLLSGTVVLLVGAVG
jgi:hypothetical protein